MEGSVATCGREAHSSLPVEGVEYPSKKGVGNLRSCVKCKEGWSSSDPKSSAIRDVRRNTVRATILAASSPVKLAEFLRTRGAG